MSLAFPAIDARIVQNRTDPGVVSGHIYGALGSPRIDDLRTPRGLPGRAGAEPLLSGLSNAASTFG